MIQKLIAEYLDDIALGCAATAAISEGFLGVEAGNEWLQSMKNAQD